MECRDWDGQVAHDDTELAALRARFECVRVTQMNHVNLARFEFDYDNTWAAFFVDADLNVYSRYGGRDAGPPDGRMSLPSLMQTMREVLAAHARRPAKGQPVLTSLLHPAPARTRTPEDMPLLRTNHRGCVHCHQVQEYRILQAYHDGGFRRRDLFGYPLPENIGLKFDRGHGHRVQAIVAGSAAAKTQLAVGDVITRVNDVPIRSEEDVRWALHRAADDRPVVITATRAAVGNPPATSTVQFDLRPTGEWRQTDLGWRKSVRSMPVPWGFLAFALTREQCEKLELPPDSMAIRVASVRGEGLASQIGLKRSDLIIAVSGRSRAGTFDDLKSDLLRACGPGDPVHLTVLREGQTLELRGTFPKWRTTATSVP